MKFKTTLLQAGKTATGIEVPPEIIANLGAGKKPPVRVTINGYTYRSTVAVMGGAFLIPVSAEHRKGANVNGGDDIEVALELDIEPRAVDLPEVFQKALEKNAAARKHFEALSYSKQNGIVTVIKGAKTEETMHRRIEKALSDLQEGKV